MTEIQSKCQNCGTSFDGEYCARCGQRNINLERPITSLVLELIRETLEVDGRAFRTLRKMLLQPGVLTSAFLAGKRRSYTSPLRLYLVISVVFFVLIAWLAQRGLLLDPNQNIADHAAAQASFMTDTLPRLMFLFMPVFALFLKLAYLKRFYFDHLIHAVHLHSIAFIALAAMLPFENYSQWWAVAIQSALLLYLLAYLLRSMRHVYQSGWTTTILKLLLVLLAYLGMISAVIEAASNMQILSD